MSVGTSAAAGPTRSHERVDQEPICLRLWLTHRRNLRCRAPAARRVFLIEGKVAQFSVTGVAVRRPAQYSASPSWRQASGWHSLGPPR